MSKIWKTALRRQKIFLPYTQTAFKTAVTYLLVCTACPVFSETKSLGDFLNKIDDPGSTKGAIAPRDNIVLQAQRDKTIVKARYAFLKNNVTYSLVLQGPIDEKADSVELADLDGLSGGTGLTLGFTHTLWNPPAGRALAEERDQLCKEYAQLTGKAYDGVCDDQFFDRIDKDKWADKFFRLAFGDKPIYLYSINAKLVQEKFDYADSVTLEEHSDTKEGYAANIFVGIITLNNSLYSLGYRRERSYKTNDKAEICSPLGSTNVLRCKDLTLGEPTTIDKDILFFDFRKFFGRYALASKISYLLDDDVTGVELPFYFLPDKTGRLIGGLSAGWRSDDDSVSLSFFIGSAFDFLD